MSSVTTRFDNIIYVDMENFGNFPRSKFLCWELKWKFPKIRNQPTLWQFDTRTFQPPTKRIKVDIIILYI